MFFWHRFETCSFQIQKIQQDMGLDAVNDEWGMVGSKTVIGGSAGIVQQLHVGHKSKVVYYGYI